MNYTERVKHARKKRRENEPLSIEEVALLEKEATRDKAKNDKRSEIRKKRKNNIALNETESKTLVMLDKSSKKYNTDLQQVRIKRKHNEEELNEREKTISEKLDFLSRKNSDYDSTLRKKHRAGVELSEQELIHFDNLNKKVRKANAKYQPKKSRREKERRRKEWLEYMSGKEMEDEIWTPEYVEKVALECLQLPIVNETTGETFTVETVLKTFGGYFGTTKQKLERECFAWLTRRGGNKSKKSPIRHIQCRPVLIHGDNRYIKPLSEAVKIFNFKAIILAKSTLRVNVCAIEDFLQAKFQHLKLGTRLWRHVAKGEKYVDYEELCCVFFTYSFDLPNLIETGRIKVQK